MQIKNSTTLGSFGVGMGKGSVGAGVCGDASFVEKLERVDISEYSIAVPSISASCIDERVDKDGTRVQFAKTAGGPLSLVYALRLSGIDRYADKTELELVDVVMDALEDRGIAQHFAVHDDYNDGCGCGACAKAHDVDNEIASNFDVLCEVAHSLIGRRPDNRIQKNAQSMDSGFFADDRVAPLTRAQDDGALIEDLVGGHDGQAVIINNTPDTTVNSVRLRADGMRAFVVDAWVFPGLAGLFAQNQEERQFIEDAQLLFNLATASVLCSSDIRVVIA